MGDQGVKLTGIRQIVRLKEMLRKWHSVTVSKKEEQLATVGEEEDRTKASGIPPPIDNGFKAESIQSDSDEEGYESPDPAPDVPKGHCPVYIGLENRRFVIPTGYLGLPVFKRLLKKTEEEYGFDNQGALAIPCEVETFKYILQCVERYKKGLLDYDLE